MEKPQKIIVTEEGHLYQLKRPLYKQGLFWLSLILGGLALIFFLATWGIEDENQAIHSALERAGMYYDDEEDELYYYWDENQEFDLTPVLDRLSSTSLKVAEQLLEEPDKVDPLALEPALQEIKREAKFYSYQLEAFYHHLLLVDEELTEDDAIFLEESIESYRGFINLATDAVFTAFATKEEEKRAFTQEEIEMIQDSLYGLLYDETQDWLEQENLEATGSL